MIVILSTACVTKGYVGTFELLRASHIAIACSTIWEYGNITWHLKHNMNIMCIFDTVDIILSASMDQ